jgi:cell division protein FtsB
MKGNSPGEHPGRFSSKRRQYPPFIWMNMTRKALFPLVAGFVFSSVLLYFLGDAGVVEYRAMNAYKESLKANVGSLALLNDRLKGELKALRDDPWKLEILAGELGLYRDGDKVVRLEEPASTNVSYEAGNLLRLAARRGARNPILKAAGLGFWALLAGISFAAARRRKRENDIVRGKS